MTNYAIADNFSLLAKLMDIHGENSFKSKSYSIAAYTIENLPVELSSLESNKIFAIKGIGDATGKKVIEQLETGTLSLLNAYLEKTPAGVIEMLNIKGLGPKKIATVWKELGVESIGELLYACNENRLLLYKGFGAKTQTNIREAIEFYLNNQGSHLYAQVEQFAYTIQTNLEASFEAELFLLAGDFRRHLLIIDKIEWITTLGFASLESFFDKFQYSVVEASPSLSSFKGPENLLLQFHHTNAASIYYEQFIKSASADFLHEWQIQNLPLDQKNYPNEEAIFSEAGLRYIPAFLRETADIIQQAKKPLPKLIEQKDITAIIHSHSKWSDGVNTIEEMATAAKQQGLQFLVISDHSKSAFYANGLNEERISAQHAEIDELNQKLAPFKIFKSIESDILNDGSLDYADDVLKTFDLVIASVHSNLKMSEEKAMQRLIKAIESPFTNILGHMTGRLLLSRNGYPVDHKKIIDACAANNVVIELNAHPRRLDIDWQFLPYAIDKGVLISIDPDAHATTTFNDVKYGVLAAQKGGVTKEKNLSSFSLANFQLFLQEQYKKRP